MDVPTAFIGRVTASGTFAPILTILGRDHSATAAMHMAHDFITAYASMDVLGNRVPTAAVALHPADCAGSKRQEHWLLAARGHSGHPLRGL